VELLQDELEHDVSITRVQLLWNHFFCNHSSRCQW
jgi:hypothetical protein